MGMRRLHRLGMKRPTPEDSVAWEIEHHIEELADRLVDSGWEAEQARVEAERRFGDPARYAPRMRRMEKRRNAAERRTQGWDMLREGFTSAHRVIRHQPGFAITIMVTLALGIGANVTMYGIVDRLLLQPPDHVLNPRQVRRVMGERPHIVRGEMTLGSTFAYPDYADFKSHSGLEVAAYTLVSGATIGSGATAIRAEVALTTSEFFPLLGVPSILGRIFTEEEASPGAALTAVIGADYWERAFGSDPGVLGRTVEVDGREHTIIGVAPSGFTGVDLARVDLWLPLEATHAAQRDEDSCLERRGCWWLKIVARLREGTSDAAARAEATRLHLNGRREHIARGVYSERTRIVLSSLVAARGPQASKEALVARLLLGVSMVVLLIACANVANLLMARGTHRRREIAVRCALGAPRRRVLSQVMFESVLLAIGGGAVAIVLAGLGGSALRQVLLPDVHFPHGGVTLRLVAFTVVATTMAGLLAGLTPALQAGRTELLVDLNTGGRGSSVGRSRLRDLLTVFQATMSVVLLVGAGLFLHSLHEVRSLDLGLDVDRLILADLEFSDPNLSNDDQNRLYEQAARRLTFLPGVQSVAATGVPFQWAWAVELEVPSVDSIPTLPGGGPYYYPVSPRYFETVGLRVEQGRPIEASDEPGRPRVAVINATMARALWPNERALGRCLLVGPDAQECTTVVGVTQDASRGDIRDEPFMAYYVPSDPARMPHRGLYVRATTDPDDLVAEVAPVLRSFSPRVRYANVHTLRQVLDPQARAWTLGATMFTVFGILALTLAAVGLYSVLAFDVAQRTREIGIRSALGAERSLLLRSVLSRGARLGSVGVMIGIGVAYLAGPYLGDLLFQTSPRNPWILAGVGALLVAVSATAGLAPGVRATRVDPVTALRAG